MLDLALEFKRPKFTLQVATEVGAGATGIFGPSGCGKSTLLALVAGLLKPDRGSIVFQGDVLADTARGVFVPAWRRRIALVFQDGQLFPHLNVRDNLLYGFQRCAPQLRRFELDAVLGLLEIGNLLQRRPRQLSGGQRQRVALGRALLYSPRMLLLDEPLAALDDRLKAQILPFLVRVKRETKIPMLYVSHARSELDFLVDRTLAMADGRLPA